MTTDPYSDVDDHTWTAIFTIIVNDPPVIGIMTNQSLLAPDSHSWAYGSSLTSDPEGLSYTRALRVNGSASIPSWLHYDLSDYSFWLITSSNAYAGDHLVTVVITDDFNTEVTQSFILEISLNDAPQRLKSIKNYSVVNYRLLTIDFESIYTLFADPEGRTMTASARQGNGQPLPSFLEYFNSTNTLSGIPRFEHIGEWTVSYIATDDINLEGSISFTVTVKRKCYMVTNIA